MATYKLEYKGFEGDLNSHIDDNKKKFWYGKITNINDVVTYDGETIFQAKNSFQQAVDDFEIAISIKNPELV